MKKMHLTPLDLIATGIKQLRHMLRRLSKWLTQNATKILVLASFVVVPAAAAGSFADNADYLDKTLLTLEDGRKVELARVGHEHFLWSLTLRDNESQVVWQKQYSEDYQSLWHFAFFIRMRGHRYIEDLDKDGSPEIAMSTWSGGNSGLAPAIVFSVNKRELKIFKIFEDYQIEMANPLFNSDGRPSTLSKIKKINRAKAP